MRHRKLSNFGKQVILIAGSILFIMILFIILLSFITKSITGKEKEKEEVATKNTIEYDETGTEVGNTKAKQYKTENGTVEIEELLTDIALGYTFYLDKGNLKLYADIVPTIDGNLMITGKEFHMDEEMKDGAIKELFTLQDDGSFANTNGDIIVKYHGLTATFEDHRGTVALKFSGELAALEEELINGVSSGIDYSHMVSADIATKIEDEVKPSVEGVIVDEYSEDGKTEGLVITDNFEESLSPSNEKKKFTITAKFVESCSNSGTRYEEIHSGITFYTFGAKFPYNSDECNTVTIVGTYRGNEQHFNGLQMDNKYPCFVTNSIRKPTEDEVQ